MSDWGTKTDDLALAQSLIEKYIDLNDGQELVLYEYIAGDRVQIAADAPEWLHELRHRYRFRYGHKLSEDITNKVVSHWLTCGATVH